MKKEKETIEFVEASLENALEEMKNRREFLKKVMKPAEKAEADLEKATATEKVRLQGTKEPKVPNLKLYTESVDVKDRHELGKLISEAKANNVKWSVKRCAEDKLSEGYRYTFFSEKALNEDVDIHVTEDEVRISDASGEDVGIIPIDPEKQELEEPIEEAKEEEEEVEVTPEAYTVGKFLDELKDFDKEMVFEWKPFIVDDKEYQVTAVSFEMPEEGKVVASVNFVPVEGEQKEPELELDELEPVDLIPSSEEEIEVEESFGKEPLTDDEIRQIAHAERDGLDKAIDMLNHLRPNSPTYTDLTKKCDTEECSQDSFWNTLKKYGVDLNKYFDFRDDNIVDENKLCEDKEELKAERDALWAKMPDCTLDEIQRLMDIRDELGDEEFYNDTITKEALDEASSAEKRAYKNGGDDRKDLEFGKALARIKDPHERAMLLNQHRMEKNGKFMSDRQEVGKTLDRKLKQSEVATDKKLNKMYKAGYDLDGAEPIDESVKIQLDELTLFKPWGGAKDVWELIISQEKLPELDKALEDMYPDGITASELNDILWFEKDWIFDSIEGLEPKKPFEIRDDAIEAEVAEVAPEEIEA